MGVVKPELAGKNLPKGHNKPIRLVLFFTEGVSLRVWDEVGTFDREVALYRGLQDKGVEVTFVTYGDRRDLSYAKRLGGIRIICNKWQLPPKYYVRLLPILLSSVGRDWIGKSNQTLGANIALEATARKGQKFVARGGYLLSDKSRYAKGAEQREQALALEKRVFNGADKIVVTTDRIKQQVISDHDLDPQKLRVIPNHVDTKLFAPQPDKLKEENSIVYAGRLRSNKNPSAMLAAIKDLKVRLYIAGEGEEEQSLRGMAAEQGSDVIFLGRVPNEQLPALLNKCSLFVLPSFYEGHPKALIEAMACGLAVIGADVPGISDLLVHAETGYLCGTSAPEIRAAIESLLTDEPLRKKLGINARRYVEETLSYERILNLEMDLLSELASGN